MDGPRWDLAFSDAHFGVAGVLEAQFVCGGAAQINNTAFDERAAIIDAHGYFAAIFFRF